MQLFHLMQDKWTFDTGYRSKRLYKLKASNIVLATQARLSLLSIESRKLDEDVSINFLLENKKKTEPKVAAKIMPNSWYKCASLFLR
jgi:hypothetical protein